MIVACEVNEELFMNRYLDYDCAECEYYDALYGCLCHSCPTYQGKLEMEADKECDRRRDTRMEERLQEAKDER